MKESVYKSAMSQVQISEDFEEVTYRKLMREMEKPAQSNRTNKERLNMEKTMKRKVTGWTVGIAACAVLSISLFTMNRNDDNVGAPPASSQLAATQPAASQPTASEPAVETAKPPIMGKVAVNIDGVISEVSEDGKSFKVGDLWVTITDQTQFGSNEPTAEPPSEELLAKEFKVGNIVSGYTSEDVSTGKVNATRIYNNIPPQQ